ncbi:glycosyltransferase family 2 protein [Pseudobutyrivibrio sp.]|jgi:glycosyltransferase involved in cell wall biosynthesis|uniref:glycosyltransferase family 2 protein n=1 Tax=Pseudobutyrivibrio sp. TaxID=2014367 RepID=UPI0025D4A935|nr:glycosyltransferase family 2 protein [Pseudobutyrivibrio sp.]
MFEKEQPLVSVLVAAYNEEKYIERCISSLINQTYKNLEIIIVDDGSTDGTFLLCKKLADKDKRIQIIHQDNEGLPLARKKGLEMARGDYIQFVDGDDWCEHTRFEKMVSCIRENDVDIVFASAYRHREDGVAIICNLPIESGTYGINDIKDIYIKPLFGDLKKDCLVTTGYLWCCLFKREVFNDIIFYKDVIVHEDEVLLLQVLLKTIRLSVLEEPLYNYNRRMNTLSKRNTYWDGYWKNMKSMFFAKEKIGSEFFSSSEEYMPRLCTSIYQKFLRAIRNECHYMNPSGVMGGLKNLMGFDAPAFFEKIIDYIDRRELTFFERVFLFSIKHRMLFIPYSFYFIRTCRMRNFQEKTKN